MSSSRRTIDRQIAAVAIPAALALATDPLYDLCDTAILGHIGTAQLAGAALATRILAFGYAAFVFLMFGTTAAVARHHGAGREREAAEQGVGAMWLAAGCGLLAAGVFAVVGRSLIGWFGGTSDVARYAWTYLWVSLGGLPAFTMVMAGVGFLRGGQDTRRPLAVSAVTVTLNLVLEVLFVYGAGLGVGASALGTVIAKWVGAAAYLTLLGRSVRRHGASWRPQPAAIRGQLVVGRDLVVRTVVLLGVFSAAQAGAARVGVDELAAYAIAFQLWMIGAYAVDGIEAAGQSLIAHRIGAGRTDEVRAVVGRLVRWALTLGCSVGAILAATSALSPHLFTNDTNVVAAASASLLWVAAMQPVGSLAFALDGVLVGAGRQRYLAGAMVAAGAAFALTTVAVGRRDLAAIWVAVTTFMAVRALTGVWGVRRLTPT
ncbi:MAG TPA: MATE family efflux transporter [Microthrixaceae bacterium]|nr:MATE family efflux transporter [Microthrixaceae bacterium]